MNPTHQQREGDGCEFDLLDDEKRCQTEDLDPSEHMYPVQRDVAQIPIVGLVLDRHQQQEHTVNKLLPKELQHIGKNSISIK